MPSPRIALYIFLGWSLLQAVLLVVSHRQNRYMPLMRAAVEKVEPDKPANDKEAMAKAFAVMSVIWFVLVTIAAAYTFDLAATGNTTALVGFVLVGGWSLYDAASSPFVLGKMYPGSISSLDWLAAIVGTGVWSLLFMVLFFR